MGNMSYCRFENTERDLQECLDELHEIGGLSEVDEDDKEDVKKLIELCKEMVEYYGDEE